RREQLQQDPYSECLEAHSISSSASVSSEGGTVRPSALAALTLMTSSNLVGCSTGRSAGLAPFRIFSTKVANRRWRGTIRNPEDIRPPASGNSRVAYMAGRRLLAAKALIRDL